LRSLNAVYDIPQFETTRAKLLPIPSLNGNINYVEWAEEADPFAAVLSFIDEAASQLKSAASRKIFVDNSIRTFVVDGLLQASDRRSISSFHDSTDKVFGDSANNISHRQQALQVFSAPPEITQMRERKSEAELQILKCVNEVSTIFLLD
jgi:Xaa-Pro aminopeptidase